MNSAAKSKTPLKTPAQPDAKKGARAKAKPEDAESVIKRMEKAAADQEKIHEAARKIGAQRVRKESARADAVEKKVRALVAALAIRPATEPGHDLQVKPGESVKDVSEKAIKTGLKKLAGAGDGTGPVERFGRILLTAYQAAELKEATKNFTKDIAAEELDVIMKRPGKGSLPGLVRNDPSNCVCCDKTFPGDRCDEILSGGAAETPSGMAGGPGDATPGTDPAPPPAATEAEILAYLGKVLAGMAAPAGDEAGSKGQRASADKIQADLDQFTLKGGPADNTSFFDFHHLQVAFDHVWKDAIDEGVIKAVTDLYRLIIDVEETFDLDALDNLLSLADFIGAITEKVVRAQELLDDAFAVFDLVPDHVSQAFVISSEQWHILPGEHRESLKRLADILVERSLPNNLFAATAFYEAVYQMTRQNGLRIIQHADRLLITREERRRKMNDLVKNLNRRLREPYAFTVYAADKAHPSINFGIVTTYRQKWDPINYQAGRLVKTIPLAPKEVRKFSKKLVVKQSRAHKEIQNSSQSRKDDSSESSRAEAEIIQKAHNKTNFNMAAEGGFDLGVGSGKASTGFGKEAGAESQETKRDFREAVLKSAEEYKNERTVEINTTESTDAEAEESGEISNPNDEIPVTYLFYELQRRYRISEKIHRLTPVVLVAQKVPRPDEIDDDWLVAHDWILKRVILDDSFLLPLCYLSTRMVGDEHALGEMQKNLAQQRRLLEALKDELVGYHQQTGVRYAALEKAIVKRAEDAGHKDDDGGFFDVLDVVPGVGQIKKGLDATGLTDFNNDKGSAVEASRIVEDASKDAYERAAKEEREMRGKLDREVTALAAATEAYTKALSNHLNHQEQLARLRVHVKDNILYYMQAIWSYEPPDQRFFRLHKVIVPDLRGTRRVRFNPAVNDQPLPSTWNLTTMGTPSAFHAIERVAFRPQELKFKTLVEIADLDNLLGFKGNYMIFPLKESNDLTDFMMRPYVDDLMGLADPDAMGNWTLDDFARYVCGIKKTSTAEEFNAMLPTLKTYHQRLLSSPRRTVDEVIIPTGSLFIEALPGKHPILEDFKLQHRKVDVQKVQAEVRHAELENLRAAARILAGEREDPDIEKKIVIEGRITHNAGLTE
jgi:hypothetical protein